MRIERTRHVDASEPDESGMYEYRYEYDLYRFSDGSTCLVARSYVDEPDEAHFLNIEKHGVSRPLRDDDLAQPLFLVARAHLRAEGKRRLYWLNDRSDGYELVP